MRLANQTSFTGRYHRENVHRVTESSEDILLAQMELFVIIVAVIAVVAALLLLVLLQIRIKKQAALESSTVSHNTCEASMEEIAAPDPNDPYLKTGPPPYIEVMKSPELYPLSSSCNIHVGFEEAKVQRLSQSCPDTCRSQRSWSQLITAVLRPDDLVPSSPPEKYTNSYASSHSNSFLSGSPNTDVEIFIDEEPLEDDVLPSYVEVCFAGVAVEPSDFHEEVETTEIVEDNCTRLQDNCELEQNKLPGDDPVVEKINLNGTTGAFTISNAVQNIIVEGGLSRSRSQTM